MLKYLFIAIYKDGTTFIQTQDDVSSVDPKKSAFFDVNHKNLKSFLLYNDTNTFLVNLEDGHFEVNGVPFFLHEDPKLKDFSLIFFRQHTHSFVVSKNSQKEISHKIVYRMGWQCTVDGKNHQRVMQFS